MGTKCCIKGISPLKVKQLVLVSLRLSLRIVETSSTKVKQVVLLLKGWGKEKQATSIMLLKDADFIQGGGDV